MCWGRGVGGRRKRKHKGAHRGPNCVENGGCCAGHYSAAQHLEHAVHGSDTGRVDVQRLVEGTRALPTDTHGAGRVRRAWSGRGMLVCMHTRVLTGHCAGAHKEHVVHGRNPRSVKAEQLVESRCLPSRKEQTRCGGEIRGTEAWTEDAVPTAPRRTPTSAYSIVRVACRPQLWLGYFAVGYDCGALRTCFACL